MGPRGFEYSEVEIKASLGEIYPEGDFRDIEAFDCCPRCWIDKVRPALIALGGKLYTYKSDEGRLPSMPMDPNAT
jgi:hypothetical protein